jgi:hypothetical protein
MNLNGKLISTKNLERLVALVDEVFMPTQGI